MSAPPARKVPRAYHDTWTSGDISTAGRPLAAEFHTRAPVGSYNTNKSFLSRLTRFRGLVTDLDHVSALDDEDEATLIYAVHTETVAGTLRTAEHFRLDGEQITATTLILDATNWKAMLAQQGANVDANGQLTRP